MRRLLRWFVDHVQAQPTAPVAREWERFKLRASDESDLHSLDAWWPTPSAIPAAERADKLIVELSESVYVLRQPDTPIERWTARIGWVFVPLHRATLSRGEGGVKP